VSPPSISTAPAEFHPLHRHRSAWARRTGLDLEIPVHYCVKLGETMQIADNENPSSSSSWRR